MTVATLEELMTNHGAEEVLVGTEVRWVTRDHELRAVIGPKRHRALPGNLRKRGSGRVLSHEEDTVRFTVGGPINPANGSGVILGQDEAVLPMPKASRWSRFKAALKSEDVHHVISHTAVDVILWSVAVFAAVAAVRGVIWLVTL